jgi:predicted phage terminase large subunit-like protein
VSIIRYEGQNIDVERSLIALDQVDCAESLAKFIRLAWHILEPSQPYVHNWHIDAICEHLEAITDSEGLYNRLLINIPPGCMKSLLVNVLWPAWEWGPKNMPHTRWINAAHSQELAIRDANKMRRLIMSDWYQARWPHVKLTADQNQKMKFENDATGFRQAAAAGSITGNRGDRLIIDDPHSVEGAASDQQRKATVEWFLEAVPTRMNNPDSSTIVVIMQRLHEDDVSGVILDKQLGYDHLMLPMRYDPLRAAPTRIGFEDPRTEPGELLFPDRFPPDVVDRDERVMGPYATAGQFQQEPAPRGGGIIKRDWWRLWPDPVYPPMEFVCASLDTAYTVKTENDFSALTVWGVFSGSRAAYANRWATPGGRLMGQEDATAMFDQGMAIRSLSDTEGGDSPKAVLMFAWAERLELHDLVQKVADTCKKMKVDRLLIENKASGYSVAQEMRRLFSHELWAVQLLDPKGTDKLARLYSVQHLFSEGMIYAPDKNWADMVITQASVFPKGKHDDLVDTVSQALRHLRDIGLLTRQPEWAADVSESMQANTHGSAGLPPIYPS